MGACVHFGGHNFLRASFCVCLRMKGLRGEEAGRKWAVGHLVKRPVKGSLPDSFKLYFILHRGHAITEEMADKVSSRLLGAKYQFKK